MPGAGFKFLGNINTAACDMKHVLIYSVCLAIKIVNSFIGL